MTNDDKKKSKKSVAFIDDPFAFKTLEVTAAQNSDEELELDGDLKSDLAQLERLTDAIAVETAKEAQELTTAAEDVEDAAQRLAEEIAEDEDLARQLAEQSQEAEQNDKELQEALPAGYDVSEMESCIEALLFMTDKPLSMNKLREYLGPDFSHSLFQQAMTNLRDRFKSPRHGIEVVEVAGGFQLRTKLGRAPLAQKLARVQTQKLSTGAMESLAIIAYRQPVMKDDIDKIRGVDSSYFIRGLLDRRLIKMSGRSELPGRPILYATTDEFLELFALKDLSAMPSLRELEQMIPASEVSGNEDDPRVKELRRLVGRMNADDSTALNYNPSEDEQILKEIKERVSSISTTTPYLEEQKALAKQQELDAQAALAAAEGPQQPELPVS